MSRDDELGDYRIGRRIAVGGMAEIFEATRRDGVGPPLVLKRLLPQYAKDPEVVRMLEHEGALVLRLSHPCLIRVIDIVAHAEEPYLVLERIDGASADVLVSALAERGERCTLPMALALVLPLLDALAFVHEAKDDDGAPLGIVHRDVTPHNVLVSRDGTVKLGDFGIARSSMRDARTKTGVIKGKLRYLAPEQVTGSMVDARTDLYAVGVLLFELLAAEPYLSGASEVDLLRAAEQPSYRGLTGLVEGADPRLDRILSGVLSRFAEQRPKRAATLRAELTALVDVAEIEEGRAAWAHLVSVCAPAPPFAEPAPSKLAKVGASVLRWGLITGIALTGAAAVFVTVWKGAGEDPASLVPPAVVPNATNIATLGDAAGAPSGSIDGGSGEGDLRLDGAAEPGVHDVDPDPAHPPTSARRGDGGGARVVPTARVLPTEPQPPLAAQELDRLRGEVATVRRELTARGILVSDLTGEQQRGLSSIDQAIDRGDAEAARREIDPVAALLRAIVVDEPFVRAKLERVDARIRAARRSGTDTREVERLGELALQDLLERRPDATNRRLNEMLGRLRAP